MLGWIKLCCNCDQHSGHVSTVLSHHQLAVINVRHINTIVCFSLFPKVCQTGKLLKEDFFSSKMLKISLHLTPSHFECGGGFISTHKKKQWWFKESSCTSSSLKSNVDSMLPRAYQHIFFQSINAAFKTLTQLTFLLSEWTTWNYSMSPKGIPNYLMRLTLIFHVLEYWHMQQNWADICKLCY